MTEPEVDFGFLFSQVSHFYGMSYREILDMPIRAFWVFSNNIKRIQASNDQRSMAVGAATQSGDDFKDYSEKLVLELGEVFKSPVVVSAERDEAGFADLKAMALGL